ncbi:MAG: hypothetical protein FWF52_08730 [Candidatus Azobacteroides sp.]|nr:hypothetical protein [Candidatus Azobacteroides sp.]
MKKSIFIIAAILLISVIIFSACNSFLENEGDFSGGNFPKVYSAEEGRFDVNETEFVTMKISPESGLINSDVKLIIENHTKGVLMYGTYYSVEYFDKENWMQIHLDNIAFEDIGFSLFVCETVERGFIKLSLIEENNNGKKGRYRVVKHFRLSYNFQDPWREIDSRFDLYIEFEIK